MPDFNQLFTNMMILIVGSTLLIIFGTFAIIYLFNRANHRKAEALMATGTQGTAKVLSLQDTGMRVNNNPRVSMLLEVDIPGYSAYRVNKTLTVPMIKISQVQVGATIPVLADPTQPNNPDKLGLLIA